MVNQNKIPLVCGDEDDFLSELVEEYESDTVGDSLKNEKLAKLVNKMFRCKLSEKNLKIGLTGRRVRLMVLQPSLPG